MIELYEGDCLTIMPTLPANSVDCVITDPPYFRVKGEAWDRQWDKPAAFIAWLERAVVEMARVLKPNGSLYLFASPKMAARVEVMISEHLNVLNRIRWIKADGWHKKADKETIRSFLSPWEEIVFAEHHGADNIAKGEAGYQAKCDELRGFIFEPLRAYFAQYSTVENWPLVLDVFESDGRYSSQESVKAHADIKMGRNSARWDLCDERLYEVLRRTLNMPREYEDLRRQYEDLRRQYEDLRRQYEDLRRPFNVTTDTPYTDVWDFAPVPSYPGKHPCEKPQAMLEHMILSSTRPDAVILDPFMGSGATGQAARRLGRGFIGIELNGRYFAHAKQRLSAVAPVDITGRTKRANENRGDKPRTLRMELTA